MKKVFTGITTTLLGFAPLAAFAQVIATGTDALTITNTFGTLIRVIAPMLIALIFVLIVVRAIQFIMSDGDMKEEMKGKLLKAIIGAFVALAAIGIIAAISSTLGIGIGGEIDSTKQPTVIF
jgi:hypothetical protein